MENYKHISICLNANSENENNNDRIFLPIFSIHNTKREIERKLSNFSLRKGFLAIVIGICNIPLIEYFIQEKNKQGGSILVLEADTEIADYILQEHPFWEKEINCIFTNDHSRLEKFLSKIPLENFYGYRFFLNPICQKLAFSAYNSLLQSFSTILSGRFSDFFTRLKFQEVWLKNIVLQTILFSEFHAIHSLFHQFSNQTVILVSTGPSLRMSLPFLKKIQNRVFIASVDSAYRILIRSGITPHIIYTLDSQTYTMRHFLGLPLGEKNTLPILIADLVSNPQVTRRWKGELFFSNTCKIQNGVRVTTSGSEFIEENLMPYLLSSHDSFLTKSNSPFIFGDVQSGGSVSTSLFDILRLMQFTNIILLGQDLAYSWNEIHCVGTHHTDEWISKQTNRFCSIEDINYKIIRLRNLYSTTSIQNRKIKSDFVLSIYATWLQESISTIQSSTENINIYNATKEGLPILGAIPIQLDTVLKSNEKLEIKKVYTAKHFSVQEYWHKVVQFHKYNIYTNKLVDFYQYIIQKQWDSKLIEEFPFLENIGKIHKFQSIRKGTITPELANKKAEIEQKKLWEDLQKVFSNYLLLLKKNNK